MFNLIFTCFLLLKVEDSSVFWHVKSNVFEFPDTQHFMFGGRFFSQTKLKENTFWGFCQPATALKGFISAKEKCV